VFVPHSSHFRSDHLSRKTECLLIVAVHSFYEVSVRPSVRFTSEIIHRSAVQFGIDALQDCSSSPISNAPVMCHKKLAWTTGYVFSVFTGFLT